MVGMRLPFMVTRDKLTEPRCEEPGVESESETQGER